MIRINEVDIHGWRAAIRGMRNAKNSWDQSDSTDFEVGPNDLTLMANLSKAGSDHAKFMRYLHVSFDLNAPLYFWKEFETYRAGVAPMPLDIEMNSCSTMHKIHAKHFEESDFSAEHLREMAYQVFLGNVKMLNHYRDLYLRTKDKVYWWQMIQLLPTNYNQKRTIDTNYAALKAMYHARKNHKLDEWREFCKWVETLPYAQELIVDAGR